MAEISISQMDTIINPSGGDLIEVAAPDIGSASGYTTGKESLSAVANLVATGTQFAGLKTTDQTLVGSINEVKETSSGNLAEAYDGTATYNEGDYCTYDGVLYICNTDNTTGTWDAQYWDAVKITDVLGDSLHTYSTTEKVVGTWVNGKPIYEKSFQFSNITVQAGQVYEIQTNALVPNYENWVGFECVATTYNIVMNCNYYGSFTPYGWSASVVDDVIAITRGTAGDVTSDYVITLRYTKTTD